MENELDREGEFGPGMPGIGQPERETLLQEVLDSIEARDGEKA